MTVSRLPVRARAAVLGFSAALVVMGVSRISTAEPSVVVAVDCPELGDEPRAALEARARAELMVREIAGTLVVRCRESAQLSWHPLAGDSVQSSVALAGAAPTDVERILEALDPLLGPRTNPEPGPAPDAGAASPSGTSTAPPPPAPTVAPVVTPLARPEPVAPPATQASAQNEDEGAWSVAAGGVVERWSSEVVGAAGGRARGELGLPGRFSMNAGAAVLLGLEAPSDVSARMVRFLAGGEWAIDVKRHLRVGVEASVDLLHASPAASLQTAAADQTLLGGGVHVAYAVRVASFGVVTGPTLGFHPGPAKVELGDHEIFRVPSVLLGWALDVELGPI